MIDNKLLVPVERVEKTILLVRGKKVILDADLAKLYGVTTKRLNQQVKRNSDRFPEDFMFRLTQKEKNKVVANCNHLSNLRFSPALPHAFTEHGAIMAASVLNTPRAIESSIFVVRAFVRLRQIMATLKIPALCLYRARRGYVYPVKRTAYLTGALQRGHLRRIPSIPWHIMGKDFEGDLKTHLNHPIFIN